MAKSEMESKILEIKGKNGKVRELSYSGAMTCSWIEEQKKLLLEIGTDRRGIPYAVYNMQIDYADFEGIVFAVISVLPECRIILKYDSFGWDKWEDKGFPLSENPKWTNEQGDEVKITPSELHYYMRFLYRVWKMETLYKLSFAVHEENRDEVDFFISQYEGADLYMTQPERESGLNATTKMEKCLEKWFVLYSGECAFDGKVNGLVDKCGKITLYDQFPCGMFCGPKSEKNRIFNDGAFDLWGVNEEDKKLFLFELKDKDSESLGIISELFFYSCVINDLTRVKGKLEARGEMEKKSYRGYHKFPSEEWEVCAYFLAPEFYSFMNKEEDLENIIREMNKRGDNVRYGAIRFEQEEIVGSDETEFKRRLSEDWKKR